MSWVCSPDKAVQISGLVSKQGVRVDKAPKQTADAGTNIARSEHNLNKMRKGFLDARQADAV